MGAFAACLIGALAGDSVIYAIGYYFGHSLITRHPRFAHLLHAEHEARIEQMINRYGFRVFFLSRFMVGIRAPVYLTAGILRMKFRKFIVIDAVCATAVVGVFFWLSHAYGDRLTNLLRRSEIGFTVIVAISAIVVVAYFVWKNQRRKLAARLIEQHHENEACSVGAEDTRAARH